MAINNGNAPGPAGGDLIAGKYRVEAQLGAGGMGVVVAARHVDLGQLFAVKLMRPELAENVELVARFLREARAAARLQSEHVARVHDVGKLENGTPYMVLEHLVGLDLDKLLRKRGPLPIAEAIDYVLQACEAIAEAHSLGIVHRDLKPGNLFLTHRPGGSTLVKVLDFGMSKLTAEGGVSEASLTTATAMLGSPWYMSPEQVRSSKNVDCRTDVWSLGVIIHKLLTGRAAFEAETLSSCLAKIVADSPTALRDVRPDAPAGLEATILRCLEKDVHRRLQNVAELAWALAPFAPASSQVSVERATKVLMGPDAPSDRTLVLSNSALIPVVDGSTPAPVDVASGIVCPPLASSAANAQPPAVQPSSSLSMAVLPAQPGPASRTRSVVVITSLGVGALLSLVIAVAVTHREQPTSAAPTEPVVASAAAPVEPSASASESTATVAPVVGSTVEIRLQLDPASARVEVDGVLTKERPLRLNRSDRLVRIVVSAPGHLSATRSVRADADLDLPLTLERATIPRDHSLIRDFPGDGPSKPPAPTGAPPAPVKTPIKPKVSGPIETTL